MVFGNIKYPEQYEFLPEKFQKCFEFVKNNDLTSMELKRYDIDGDNIFVNLMEFTTAPVEERAFEAHKDYCDIHYIVRGSERIDICITANMEAGEYKPDIMMLFGEPIGTVSLYEGDFLVCMPQDGHRPGIMTDKPETIRKATFKVKF